MTRPEPAFRLLAWRYLRDGLCGHCGKRLRGASGIPCSCPHHWRRAYRLSKILHPMHDICEACHGTKKAPDVQPDTPF